MYSTCYFNSSINSSNIVKKYKTGNILTIVNIHIIICTSSYFDFSKIDRIMMNIV